MILCKVKSHHYTDRTASVDSTVSEMKGNLLNNTAKVTHKLTSHSRTHSLTHSPTPRSKVRLWNLTSYQVVKNFPPFYGTWKFITEFTKARHPSQSKGRSIQSMPPSLTFWTSVLILSSNYVWVDKFIPTCKKYSQPSKYYLLIMNSCLYKVYLDHQ
jgi:hypothetical protein